MKIKYLKPIFFILVLFVFILNCSIYNEEVNIAVQDYETLTPSNILTDLKVINLVVDQNEFNSMYSNYEEEIEIEGLFNLYKNGQTLIENELIELEVKGTFSASFDLKSLGLKFDDTFNNSNRQLIDPEVLPFHSLDKIKSFRLRNSGNDFKLTMLKDISLSKLAVNAELDLDLMYTEQAVVFVNDSFLGLMNIRTETNAHGLSRLYGVKKDNITLARIIDDGIVEKKDGNFERIDNFFEAIDQKNYDYLITELDISNFIDYIIYQSYIGNIDWPLNNVRMFAVNDGLFRFVLFDLDMSALQKTNSPPLSFITDPVNNNDKNPISDLFNLLYENVDFKEAYDARFDELINSGLLSSDSLETIIDTYKENVKELIPTQIDKHGFPRSMTQWLIEIDRLKYNFSKRENAAKKSQVN